MARRKGPKYVREALTDKGKKFLTAEAVERLSRTPSLKVRDLVVVDNLAWRRHGAAIRGPFKLEPPELQMFLGYVSKAGQTLSPRVAHGGTISPTSSLTTFKGMRRKVDVMRKREDWESFGIERGASPSQVRYTFRTPRGFRYAVTRPYSPEDVPELGIEVKSGFYELSPAAGIFVEVVLEDLSLEGLNIYDVWLELLPVPAVTPNIPLRLCICDLIHGAMPDSLLPPPPFSMKRGEIMRSAWAFDLLDPEEKTIRGDGITKATLCVMAGPNRQVARRSVEIRRRRYRAVKPR